MRAAAIECAGLSKRYRIGERPAYRTLRESIMTGLRGGRESADAVFWALDDVSFGVDRGEVLGIIGRNGAGKSTLLKILSRITRPTRGRALIRGRVGSLLEVGTGFHQELTGRENVFLNGAILGMSRKEIARRFDAIIAFAEIERFLDVPVKRYSSGMYMRLAFAVAAHLESEILLVDEVLAVGDAAFQKKCLGAMGDAARGGRTVVLVSHNMIAVEGLCNRAIWLDGGRLRESGAPRAVIGSYLATVGGTTPERVWNGDAPADGAVRLRRVAVQAAAPHTAITTRTPVDVAIEYETLANGLHLNTAIAVHRADGVLAFSGGNESETSVPEGTFRATCRIPGDLMNDGQHFLTVMIVRDDAHVVVREEQAVTFEVGDDLHMRGAWYGDWEGAVRPNLEWRSERLS